jgi:hypothetical protein
MRFMQMEEPQKWHNIPSISFIKMRASKLPCVAKLHLGGGSGGGDVGLTTTTQSWHLDSRAKMGVESGWTNKANQMPSLHGQWEAAANSIARKRSVERFGCALWPFQWTLQATRPPTQTDRCVKYMQVRTWGGRPATDFQSVPQPPFSSSTENGTEIFHCTPAVLYRGIN